MTTQATTSRTQNPRVVLGMRALLIIPLIGTLWAFTDAFRNGVDGFFPIVAIALYIITGFGIAIGYHRYFTHGSFDTYPLVEFALGVAGLMAWQGSIVRWCAIHFDHHEHSDELADPHTPYIHGRMSRPGLRGFWHAHFGWLEEDIPLPDNFVRRKLESDPVVQYLEQTTALWVSLSLIIPASLGFVYTGTLEGAWLGFLWGGLVRICILHHVTWCVNSVCHIWGTRPFRSDDESRDNIVIGILGFGEGFHNPHHTFPGSPCHGLKSPWIDMSYNMIRFLGLIGLVWGYKEKIPTRRQMEFRASA